MPGQLRISEQVRLIEQREASYRVLCTRHPDWRPDPRFPEPPRGSCPHCHEEAMQARPSDRPPEVRRLDAEPPVPPSQWEKVQQYMADHPEQFGGGLTREQEERALQQIEDARYAEQEEIARQRNPVGARGAKLRHANPITGVEIWEVPWHHGPLVARRES